MAARDSGLRTGSEVRAVTDQDEVSASSLSEPEDERWTHGADPSPVTVTRFQSWSLSSY